MKKIFFIFILLFLSSCLIIKPQDPAYTSLVSRLKTKGIVTLSPDNPYIASNLLIAKEINSSKELEGFIKHKGIPNLIEVDKKFFQTLKYKFFYPHEKIYYNLEFTNNVWIISGPEQITMEQNRQIFYLTGGNLFTPQILSEEELNNISPNSSLSNQTSLNNLDNNFYNPNPKEETAQIKNETDPLKTDLKKEKDKSQKVNKNIVNDSSSNKKVQYVPPQISDNSDEGLNKIINSTTTYTAEQNYRGDLIHYVAYQGENLSLISRWYTKEANNMDKIARINSIKDVNHLAVGDKIIIPAYLLKNKNKLTKGALQQMISLFENTNKAKKEIQNQNNELEYF